MDAIVVTLSRATEVDPRLSALSSLQTLLADDTQVDEAAFDALTLGLKASLRQPNASLALATLVVIPAYLDRIRTSDNKIHHLRLLSSSILPPGQGVVDRLGDANARLRDAARQALVQLGVLTISDKPAQDATPSGSRIGGGSGRDESAAATWDFAVKEHGLKNKSPKIREQCLLVVVAVRAKAPLPLRPILSTLVSLLSDADGSVRETAKEAVITIFTAPSVQSVAKAQLKKEMLAADVRKSISDAILPIVLGEVTASNAPSPSPSHHAEAEVEEGPKGIETVHIASAKDLEDEFARMMPPFEGKETEHNWAARESSMDKVRGMLLGGAFSKYPHEFVACLRSTWLEASLKALLSLRTTAAISACACYRDLATQLGTAFDPCVDIILSPLSKMGSVTKTIMVEQSQDTIRVILEKTSVLARIVLPFLEAASEDKTPRARSYAPIHLKTWLDAHGVRGKSAIEAAGGLATIETLLLKTLVDAVPIVKEKARLAYWAFAAVWPAAGKKVMDKVDGQAKKALDRVKPTASTPTQKVAPAAVAGAAGGGPAAKRTSMQAMMAAKKAELKAAKAKEAEEAARVEAASVSLPPSSPPPAIESSSGPSSRAASPPHSPSSPSRSPVQSRAPSTHTTPSKVALPPSAAQSPGFESDPAPQAVLDASGTVGPLGEQVGTRSRPRGPSDEDQASTTSPQSSHADPETPSHPASSTLFGTDASGQPSPPQTPVSNPYSKALSFAASFQDSPQMVRVAGSGGGPSLLGSPKHSDVLQKGKGVSGGWRKRLSQLDRDAPLASTSSHSAPEQSLVALEAGSPSLQDLHALLRFSKQNAVASSSSTVSRPLNGSSSSQQLNDESLGPSSSPTASHSGMVAIDPSFGQVFAALLELLSHKDAAAISHPDTSLYLLEALLENQPLLLMGHEGTVCSLLFHLRVFNTREVKESTHSLLSTLLATANDAYLLSTVGAVLRSHSHSSSLSHSNTAFSPSGRAFGLIAIGRCMISLEPQIVEEQVEKMRDVILPALVSSDLQVREAASVAILACQVVLKDSEMLFTLLASPQLTSEKKNLLTYLFDKNGAGGGKDGEGNGEGGKEKVRKEMRRLSLR